MKTLLASMAALGALALAAPAGAQDFRHGQGYGYNGPQHSYSYVAQSARQIERLRLRLREGIQARMLDRREARYFFGELNGLDALRTQYIRTRGLSAWEARDLEQRINRVRHEMRREFFDGRGYGRFDNGDRDYGWDRRYDNDDDYGADDDGPRDGRGPRGDGEHRGPRAR
ncbi:MAG: hypothetical protein AB7J28_02360 [Hyphomonadaceae bacterium]